MLFSVHFRGGVIRITHVCPFTTCGMSLLLAASRRQVLSPACRRGPCPEKHPIISCFRQVCLRAKLKIAGRYTIYPGDPVQVSVPGLADDTVHQQEAVLCDSLHSITLVTDS